MVTSKTMPQMTKAILISLMMVTAKKTTAMPSSIFYMATERIYPYWSQQTQNSEQGQASRLGSESRSGLSTQSMAILVSLADRMQSAEFRRGFVITRSLVLTNFPLSSKRRSEIYCSPQIPQFWQQGDQMLTSMNCLSCQSQGSLSILVAPHTSVQDWPWVMKLLKVANHEKTGGWIYLSLEIQLFKSLMYCLWTSLRQSKLLNTKQAGGPTSMYFFSQVKQLQRSEPTVIDTCSLSPTGTSNRPTIAKAKKVKLITPTIIAQGVDLSSLQYPPPNLDLQKLRGYAGYPPFTQHSTSILFLAFLSQSKMKATTKVVIWKIQLKKIATAAWMQNACRAGILVKLPTRKAKVQQIAAVVILGPTSLSP